jgi:hypothetical protein
MSLARILLALPERPHHLDPRSASILERVCAAAHASDMPKDVSVADIDVLIERMEAIDLEGAKVSSAGAKVRSIKSMRSARQLFI